MSALFFRMSGLIRATPPRTAPDTAQVSWLGQLPQPESVHSFSGSVLSFSEPPAGEAVHGSSVPARKACRRARTRSTT